MGYLIEYDGDDTAILANAVADVARHKLVARVTLRPGDHRDITSAADYVLSEYRGNGTVLLTLWDATADGPWVHPNGRTDEQRVKVYDIIELHVY